MSCGKQCPDGKRVRRTPVGRGTAADRRVVACRQLPVSRADLPARQPLAARAARARSTSSPGCSGHWGTTPGLNFIYVHMNRAIRQRDLDAIYVTGPGHGGPGLVASAYLDGTYTEIYHAHRARRGGSATTVPAVLVPRRNPEPCRSGDSGLDQRGRRTRLQPAARLRRGPRQPRADRVMRGRRRRGRDRTARGQLALEQVPEPRHRRCGAADPAPERLQDRESDGARPDPVRRAGIAADRDTGTRRRWSMAPIPN